MSTAERHQRAARDEMRARLIAAVAALWAGVGLATSDLLRPIFATADDVACDTGASYAVNLADLVKFVSIGFAVFMLAHLARGGLSALAMRIAAVAAIASALTGLANAFEHCAHIDAMGLVYVVALVVGLLATAWFGILLGRSQDSSRWMGWAIAFGTVALWFGAEQGWGRPVDAAFWTAVGVALLIARSGSPRRTSPWAQSIPGGARDSKKRKQQYG